MAQSRLLTVDMNPGVADAARRSAVYQAVHVAPAHQIPVVTLQLEPNQSVGAGAVLFARRKLT